MDIVVSAPVAAALARGDPVVALESTIVAHGMPYPENLSTALAVEDAVRAGGAVPATIAVLDGVPTVGCTREQLDSLARAGRAVAKASRRDIPSLIAAGATGATTVAATSLLAAAAGIDVFVTGGIGGVHRGGEVSMDVSADLYELARTPVTVVCAGAKSILDIPRTLEVLESLGVPVLAYGADEFPAFFTRHSGVPAPLRVDSPSAVAKAILAARALGMQTGSVIGVPIPEEAAADGAVIQDAIHQALAEADANAVLGRDLTPFLLKRIAELTGGASLNSNIALVLNNAAVGAAIACEVARLRRAPPTAPPSPVSAMGKGRILVVGGAGIDVIGKASPSGLVADSSAPGSIAFSPGGVALNVATALGRLGAAPLLYASVGDDSAGSAVLAAAADAGINTAAVSVLPGAATSGYVAVLESDASLAYGVADMGLVSSTVLDAARLDGWFGSAGPAAVVADGNCPTLLLDAIGAYVASRPGPRPAVYFEPTSVAKAERLAAARVFTGQVTAMSPNAAELTALACGLGGSPPASESAAVDVVFAACPRLEVLLVKRGAHGVDVLRRGVASVTVPAKTLTADQIVNVTGAGDTLLGVYVWGVEVCGMSPEQAAAAGVIGAAATLQSAQAVAPSLSPSVVAPAVAPSATLSSKL